MQASAVTGFMRPVVSSHSGSRRKRESSRAVLTWATWSRAPVSRASLTASSVERKQASSLRMAGWYFTSGSSPYRSRNDFRLADMMDESSQWVMMSRGERLNMARSASSRSTSILPVLLPMNSLTPHTLCGSSCSSMSVFVWVAPKKKE